MAWDKTYETSFNRVTKRQEIVKVNPYAIVHSSGKYKIAKYRSSPKYILWQLGEAHEIIDKSDDVERLKSKVEYLVK